MTDSSQPDGHLIEVGQTTLPGGWRQFLNLCRKRVAA